MLHVGLPKTGTTYLQQVLSRNAETLAGAGVGYRSVRGLPPSAAMFRGAVEIRGSAAKFGLDPEEIKGTWEELCRAAVDFDGTAVISHEVLAGATTEQIAAAMAPLAGAEVSVVVAARDLGRQAAAHWQEEVKLGSTAGFAEFERTQFRADTGRDRGPDAGGVRPHFWHAQDFADALRRWGHDLPAERVHLVVCPAPGAAPELLWQRFADAAGLPVRGVDLGAEAANRSLAAADVALLRAVNAEIGEQLPRAVRNRVVKREWAERDLVLRPGERPRTPEQLGEAFAAVTADWLEEVRVAGYRVHGDPADLAPVTAPGDPDVPIRSEDDPAGWARILLERGGVAPRRGLLRRRRR